jgi:hypothetical protein
MRPFAPRPITFAGLHTHEGWRLKRYTITRDAEPLDWDAFAPGLGLTLAALPQPAVTAERPGLGFVIAHRGAGADYIVLGWWDRENELPVRVVVREQTPGAEWRPARGSESFCVWDLQVIGFERDAYVATVLAEAMATRSAEARAAAYLRHHLIAGAAPAARQGAVR